MVGIVAFAGSVAFARALADPIEVDELSDVDTGDSAVETGEAAAEEPNEAAEVRI